MKVRFHRTVFIDLLQGEVDAPILVDGLACILDKIEDHPGKQGRIGFADELACGHQGFEALRCQELVAVEFADIPNEVVQGTDFLLWFGIEMHQVFDQIIGLITGLENALYQQFEDVGLSVISQQLCRGVYDGQYVCEVVPN